MQTEKNIAFIDGQNLHLGTTNGNDSWKIDYVKFRIYLKDKYKMSEAYYYLGCVKETEQDLYTKLQLTGFILKFREHTELMKGKIILISNDGDYKRMVSYLIKNKFLSTYYFQISNLPLPCIIPLVVIIFHT